MTHQPIWAVLVPGERDVVERMIRAYFERTGIDDVGYAFVPGNGRCHAVIDTDGGNAGSEDALADALSRETTEAVYALSLGTQPPFVTAFTNGQPVELDDDPNELAASLGCPLPTRPTAHATPKMRSAALAIGVTAQDGRTALAQRTGRPLPSHLRLIDTDRGLLIRSDTGDIGFADITISESFPKALVYSVVADSTLTRFTMVLLRGGTGVAHFDIPPRHDPFSPAVDNILGETDPVRILIAVGIPEDALRVTGNVP